MVKSQSQENFMETECPPVYTSNPVYTVTSYFSTTNLIPFSQVHTVLTWFMQEYNRQTKNASSALFQTGNHCYIMNSEAG
jgi:hypothetical protein